MDKTKSELRKARRNKAEQFRKSKNNFFFRGYTICRKSEANMLILVERKGKYYQFISSDSMLGIPEQKIRGGRREEDKEESYTDVVRSTPKSLADLLTRWDAASAPAEPGRLRQRGIQLPKVAII